MNFVRRFDIYAFFAFILINGLTYLFGYHFLLESHNKPVLAKINAVVIIYGRAQSFFGFVAGYAVAKLWYSRSNDGEYNPLGEENGEVEPAT
jgi:hypothetical protein